MAQARYRAGLWALLGAWAIVLLLVAGLAGYLAYEEMSAGTPPATQQAAEETEEAAPGEAGQPAAVEMAAEESGAQPAGETVASLALNGEPEAAEPPPVEAEPIEAEPVEAEPVEAPAVEAVPGVETAPAEAEAEPEPVEAEPAEPEPAEAESPQEPATAEAPLAEAAPAEEPAGAGDSGSLGTEGAEQLAATPPAEEAAGETSLEQGENVVEGAEPPWRRYGEPSQASPGQPRIAIVLTGLGLSASSTEAAIQQLPGAVSLSFTPYSRELNRWIALARANGHEVLLDLPMEPASFPNDDPGPKALLTVLNRNENRNRLDWLLDRGTAFVGVAAVMGSRFTASEQHLRPVLESLKDRGLFYLDNLSSAESLAVPLADQIGLPYVEIDRALDSDQASRLAINARLTELERLALENGFAVASGQPYPVTIERIRDWASTLAGRGFALVPVTSLAGAERKPPAEASVSPGAEAGQQ